MTDILSNGPLVVGLIMVVIHIVRKLAPKLPTKYAPWAAAVLGILTTVASCNSESCPLTQCLIDGSLTGLAAAGLWDVTKSLHKE